MRNEATAAAPQRPVGDTKDDMDRMRDAIEIFRSMGYWARANQDGGISAVPQDRLLGAGQFVLWDERETSVAFDGRTLVKPLHLLHFKRDANEIASVLMREDLFRGRVRIEATNHRVEVLPA